MKPKFRTGDRVRIIETGEELVVIDIGDSWREDDPFTYLLAGEMGRYDGGYSAWYPGDVLELVGCGIPAPALDLLRWQPVVDGHGKHGLEIVILGHIRYGIWGSYRATLNGRPLHESEDGVPVTYKSEQEAFLACQKHWEELWVKAGLRPVIEDDTVEE